jgi:hypothetical protein
MFQRQPGVQRSPCHAEGAFCAFLVGRAKGGTVSILAHDRSTISISLDFF